VSITGSQNMTPAVLMEQIGRLLVDDVERQIREVVQPQVDTLIRAAAFTVVRGIEGNVEFRRDASRRGEPLEIYVSLNSERLNLGEPT